MSMPPALPINNGHALSIVVCSILFPTISTTCVVLRFVVRAYKKVHYGLDDYLVVVALLFVYGQCTILILGMQ